jgi:hypothetical protein
MNITTEPYVVTDLADLLKDIHGFRKQAVSFCWDLRRLVKDKDGLTMPVQRLAEFLKWDARCLVKVKSWSTRKGQLEFLQQWLDNPLLSRITEERVLTKSSREFLQKNLITIMETIALKPKYRGDLHKDAKNVVSTYRQQAWMILAASQRDPSLIIKKDEGRIVILDRIEKSSSAARVSLVASSLVQLLPDPWQGEVFRKGSASFTSSMGSLETMYLLLHHPRDVEAIRHLYHKPDERGLKGFPFSPSVRLGYDAREVYQRSLDYCRVLEGWMAEQSRVVELFPSESIGLADLLQTIYENPMGYSILPEDGPGGKQASLIRDIAELFIEGVTVPELARAIHGYAIKSGKAGMPAKFSIQ